MLFEVFLVVPEAISNMLQKHNTLIDLSADFRLKKVSTYLKYYKIKHSSIKNSLKNHENL